MMATEQRILKQDGYLDVGNNSNDICNNGVPIESRNIIYHPNLNVIIVFDSSNQVKILDVHSGVTLQMYKILAEEAGRKINGRYMPLQDKVLIWDGFNVGFRGDYNGVLLLDTVLQTPIQINSDFIKFELLLSEATLLRTCIKELEMEGLECPSDVINELSEKIKNAQSQSKKSIKAQRWTTICLNVPYSSLKLLTTNIIATIKRLERNIPALAVASAINERLTDLLSGSRFSDLNWHVANFQRVLMHSEAVRRQTFEKWPHMDYKWALPDQMAQAGFYHQPSSSGEDRAMCFTCNVCLVCWEKTDEPWSEHERHSPSCPFVKGEYTQNVPLSLTYATNPAVPVPGPELGFDVISNSDYANLLVTSSVRSGDISLWSIERHLKQMHTFNLGTIMKDICDEAYDWACVTAICVLPNERARNKINNLATSHSLQSTGSTGGGGTGTTQFISTSTLRAGVVGSKIVLGISIRQTTGEHLLRMVVLKVVESDRPVESTPPTVTTDIDDGISISSFQPQDQTLGMVSAGGEGDGSSAELGDDDNKLSFSPVFKNNFGGFEDKVIFSELLSFKKDEDMAVDKSDQSAYNGILVDQDLNKMDYICEFNDFPQMLGGGGGSKQHFDDIHGLGTLVGSLNANSNDIDMDTWLQDKFIKVKSHLMNKNLISTSMGSANGNGNVAKASTTNLEFTSKEVVSEEIECVVESCTIVKRMNALTSPCGGSSSVSGDISGNQNGERRDNFDIVEIAEILPTNGECNQLLVKLLKTKSQLTKSKIIMETFEDLDDDPMEDYSDLNSDLVAAQLLLFDCTNDTVISNEYTLAMTFSRKKCPQQLCILPNLNMTIERRGSLDSGALGVVCADGTIEIYSLSDFQPIALIDEENEHFVSMIYCRNLERICGCTRRGSLIFYSLNDVDNESGDEMLDADDDCANNTLVQTLNNPKNSVDVTVTDGTSGNLVVKNIGEASTSDNFINDSASTASLEKTNSTIQSSSEIKVDCDSQGTGISGSSGTSNVLQSSPSLTSFASSNFMAYKTTDLTIEDLRAMYSLTQFEDNLSAYTAEVPSCWNDLVQAQKQRKQSQNIRHGDDTQFTKTWRLHNDATTWDEHVIELNLVQPVNLGHIDLKFTLFQQCQNPSSIQVTLLKQNTSGFGYRMKGPPLHSNYENKAIDDNIDIFNSYGGILENPVLSEEYLHAHNAEILAGPIDLSSCIGLCDQSGTVTLTSPKLFKTRTRNFLLHIKTMGDPSKEPQAKTRVKTIQEQLATFKDSSRKNRYNKKLISLVKDYCFLGLCKSNQKSSNITTKSKPPSKRDPPLGCDWLHEISINVRGVKPQPRIPNDRAQRIAMLESNILLDNLFRIVSSEETSVLAKNMALDILTWICFVRLNRYRSPKSERIKTQINKNTAASCNDLLAQQFECICLTEKYIEDTLRNCMIRSDRTMAHKCAKLILILTDGICSLPVEVQSHSTLDITIKNAIANTFQELTGAKYASVVRWFVLLSCATSTLESHNGISEICIKLLLDISKEIETRWDPFCALLGTRFGLYGFPFEPEIFEYDLPTISKSNLNLSSSLNVMRSNAGLTQMPGFDIKKLSSIDGVDFRTFPHLIKCKTVTNQLRGLLEVEQLHFNCSATSEATRIDNMDTISNSGSSHITLEHLMVPTSQTNSMDTQKDQEIDKLNNMVNNVQNMLADKQMKLFNKKHVNELKPNGVGPIDTSHLPAAICVGNDNKVKVIYNTILPKFKAICQYIEYCDEQSAPSSMIMPKPMEGSFIYNSNTGEIIPNESAHQQPKKKRDSATAGQNKIEAKVANKQPKATGVENQQSQPQRAPKRDSCDSTIEMENITLNPTFFAWHKIMSPPPKQMIVIDRMHSGARRYVVLDFGSPILLTDVVIPSCDELASLHIDIWWFSEETDSVRLIVAPDIANKTLVLSDLQPPPICRYLKITIIGRIGMSSTKCKIPIGSFFGHNIILENDAYADSIMRCIKQSSQNIQTQIKSLSSLYEDVHCRYNLASCKLMELLTPVLNSELSNVAHMQAFINKHREDDASVVDNGKIIAMYEECILLQHQINVIRNSIDRLENSLSKKTVYSLEVERDVAKSLRLSSRDKLRVLSQSLVETLLHFSIEYGIKNILPIHQLFTIDVANLLFNSLVVYGDAHIQLATCSLLVRMCCFQNWWGDFLADIFCNLFSSQNSKVFPQDRIFFLLTYLGRRSIAMGTCRSIVIDAVLKTLAKLLAPISPRYQEASDMASNMQKSDILWTKSDLQLITWLLLFLSVCLDDSNERKDKSSSRWDFMSCESDFTKTRTQTSSSSGKAQLRCFKKRIIQQNKYGVQPYTDWGKKIYMIQNEHPGIFMEMTGKPKSSKSSKSSSVPKFTKETNQDGENNFDKGLKTIRLNNILIVIRGLIALLLEMDFTCNMDQFLLTCKVIARLVSACRPSVQLSKVITIAQLEQLIRLAVWNDQQQPWAVHAITCLLQDLLDADKHFKDNDITPTNDGAKPMEGIQETKDLFAEYPPLFLPTTMSSMMPSSSEAQYPDGIKYSYLPSLIECEDTEIDEILNDIDVLERTKPVAKKDNATLNKNTFNYFCKSVTSAMDARLDASLDINIEIQLRRLTMLSSMDMYSSLPQILANEFVTTLPESPVWPDYITDIWSSPEYNCGLNTYKMFKTVFDCILADLHLQDTWIHLEQVLQMWLTLNGELSEKSYSAGFTHSEIPKIPFGANAVQGLLLALAWHNDIKLRTWSLGFQCLYLACNSQQMIDDKSADFSLIHEVIIKDENFEKMLLRFFSGYGMNSSIISNRCAGPTICKHLHELILWLHKKCEIMDTGAMSFRRKLKDTLLHVILQLVQPGGAISNQHGPIDAQSQLVRDLLLLPNDKADLGVSLNIIESVSFLVYNNISNSDKMQCQRSAENNNTSNTFSSLFANVLGSENSKQSAAVSDSSLIVGLLRLSSTLVQTELPRQPSQVPIPEEEELPNESQTDETKAEQLNTESHRIRTPCIADTVLKHIPTMKRLLGSLSQCSILAFTSAAASHYLMKPTENFLTEEPQSIADGVFNMLITLCHKASSTRLVVAPLCQYLEGSIPSHRSSMPRLQLSEAFLWYVFKVLELPSGVNLFAQIGGIEIVCKNLVKLNKVLINVQPGLISSIMQHMTKSMKSKLNSYSNLSGSNKKTSTSSAQTQRQLQDGLINFAPFCTISSENDTAQSADILIMNPVSSHRRQRTPAWSYIFYPNESHVDLTITLPTAILLKEVQLQPHAPTLASCPSAVAIEIARDYGLGAIPVGPPLTTTGMTCIRLKLAKPEIATSIVLRLYRPKDSSSIGLTQIAVLGNTIFTSNAPVNVPGTNNVVSANNLNQDTTADDDNVAKTSVGWVRILIKCYNLASITPDAKLVTDVIGASAEYPGFIEACCSMMNIMPLIPNQALQHVQDILLKLGDYDHNLCLSLIRILLWNTTPQMYKLTNESICDLLFDLTISSDGQAMEKIQILLDWILKLRLNFNNRTVRCNNPQSGFVKCIASILWTALTTKKLIKLPELITDDMFEACMYWIDMLENGEPLKTAFDSLLCSFCAIRPELFDKLLIKVNVKPPRTLEVPENYEQNTENASNNQNEKCGLTDDNKGVSGSEWFENVAKDSLSTLLKRTSYLSTLAMACQSPLAVYQLEDSGLPKLLAYALYEYCCYLSPEVSEGVPASYIEFQSEQTLMRDTAEASSCLTDSDKAIHCDDLPNNATQNHVPILTCSHVPKILDFFSDCCSVGHMREWLGSQQGAIFWKPLLELLCNHRPKEFSAIEEPMQQTFIRMERATINFFARVSACHPKNQDALTGLLISVIQKTSGRKTTISGFTRQLVLQLLLENERITVSVQSKQPLQKCSVLNGNGLTIATANHHPSKRVSAHHLLFNVSTSTKCVEILQCCVSDPRATEAVAPPPTVSNPIPNPCTSKMTEYKESNEEQGVDPFSGLNFNVFNGSLEFLSVAAGNTAKDKRIKDAKNQVTAKNKSDFEENFPNFSKFFNFDGFLSLSKGGNGMFSLNLVLKDCSDVLLSSDTTVSQILAAMHSKGQSLATPCITLSLEPTKQIEDFSCQYGVKAANLEPLHSPLQRFSSRGGLSLLAKYLPTVYPETASNQKPPLNVPEKEKSPPITDWVKLEPNDEIYEDLDDPLTEPSTKHSTVTTVPQHSLAAFGLFLRLPTYSDVLLRDKLRAQCLLRLVLGVTGDGEGNDIYSLSLAPSLPTLPFEVFRQLLDSSPLTTDDGVLLRRLVIEVGAMHLVLNCLGIFTHQSHNSRIPSHKNEQAEGSKSQTANGADNFMSTSDDKSHMYWAKGTGFGTGSTAQSWNVEQALLRQKSEEEHVTVLLQVLSSYINPGDKIPNSLVAEDDIVTYREIAEIDGELPSLFVVLLDQSCLISALSSYLRNDSVLDITRHIPLYRAILQLLRALSQSQQLVGLLQPKQHNSESSPSITELLSNMKTCVDTYAKRLKVNKKSNIKGQAQQVTFNIDDGDDEGLAMLIPDIQETTLMVQKTVKADALTNQSRLEQSGSLYNTCEDVERPLQSKSIEQRYLEVMKQFQFDTYDMIVESENNCFRFVVAHHFEKMVRMAGDRYHPSRVKRLAQEAVTLSTSLPLSYSSSVFVRCDTDRLDIMKVLITGPADTPYANGCFEFDVFFPPDYPNLPMLINLETTGRHSVRFNPNLYNDGKVCLSVLNTWHGRPEEKWNAQTSSFLQVLVSIQSLILVPEPYFNEPGFERSRGTPSGTHSSREYNSNIYQACVRWAMLEQIRNPSPCFKDVIHTHFWLKRHEICTQIENWIEELSKPQFSERSSRTISFNAMVLRRQYRHLREELAKLKIPPGLEDLDSPFNPNISPSAMPEANSTFDSNMSTAGAAMPASFSSKIPPPPKRNFSITETLASPASPPPSPPPANVSVPSGSKDLNNKKEEATDNEALDYDMRSPPPTSYKSESTPVPMLVEVSHSFGDMIEATDLLLPHPSVKPVTATATTVESNTALEESTEKLLDKIIPDVDEIHIDTSDFNYTEDEVQMMQEIFFDDDYENSKMDNDFLDL